MKKLLYIVGVLFIGIAPLVAIGYYQRNHDAFAITSRDDSFQFEVGKNKPLKVGTTLEVAACHVIDGGYFQLRLENNDKIVAMLKSATTEEARDAVIELLKNSTSTPTVTLLREIDGIWIIELHLSINETKVNLVEELHKKKLLL